MNASPVFRNLYIILIILFGLITACESRIPADSPAKVSKSPPEWSYNASIYEVNIRQYSEEGTFRAFQQDLPRLKDLGVDIIWLMPVHPIGEINRKGTLGSYYSVRDYYGINPEYGNEDDFRNLVEAVHENGMYLIIDWIANHTAWDNPLTRTNPEFYETNEDGNFIPPRGTDWDDVIQLDFNNQKLWTYMIGALRYWVEEFDIDGYRCDVADLVPTPFWNRARAELDELKPVFMLAEAETPGLHTEAFDMTYAWTMHHMMNSIARGESGPDSLENLIVEHRSQFPDDAFRMQFTSNHDENSWNGTVFERLGDGAPAFAVLASTIEGMPLVYNGQEVGMDKRLEFFEKDLIPWKDSPFEDLYRRLLNLKTVNEALWNGEKGGILQRLTTDRDESVFVFTREKNSDKILVILNLTDRPVDFRIDDNRLAGSYTELFTEEESTFSTEEYFSMKPWEYGVFIQ
jgi:cyclomaltodextrinase / maltogenic alpha-amylase / neopullulanase